LTDVSFYHNIDVGSVFQEEIIMEKKIKESVGTLLAHIIKVDKRDIAKEAPLFCEIMGQNFDCSADEAEAFLRDIIEKDYDLDKHIEIINQALCDDRISKYHLLEQLNHIIYSDKISEEDYKIFEDIKERLFSC
jgi:uncharacterized tellurite resistance protein B-like protein